MVNNSQTAPVPQPQPELPAKRNENEIPEPGKKPRFSITIVGHIPT